MQTLLSVPCKNACGAQRNLRAAAAAVLDFFRPLRFPRLASSAPGGARLVNSHRSKTVHRTVFSLLQVLLIKLIVPKHKGRLLTSLMLWQGQKDLVLNFAKHKCRLHRGCFAKTLAVPEEICAPLLRLCLISFDRCAFLALLLPPPAAQGSSTVTVQKQSTGLFFHCFKSFLLS